MRFEICDTLSREQVKKNKSLILFVYRPIISVILVIEQR
jgi:hypothetical protein